MPSAVLIPIKSFDLAKGRLSEAVAPAQRAALAEHMAATVIAAAQDLSVWVVCGDHTVADLARSHGAHVIWRAPRGLNGAIADGTEHLAARGFDRAIIAHADLPLATDLTFLDAHDDTPADHSLVTNTVYLVPDRRNDGSNVMSIPLGRGFAFHYGAGSAAAHRAEAQRVGLRFESIVHDQLGWDVDVPEDLAVLDPALLTATPLAGTPPASPPPTSEATS